MMQRIRALTWDLILVATFFVIMTGVYFGFGVVERYRGLTAAYLQQAEQFSNILNAQLNGICPEPEVKEAPADEQ